MFKNQEIPKLVIIPFILVTLMWDSGVILCGESRCWSLFRGQRVNTLTKHHFEGQLLVVNVILTAFALVSLVSLLIINSSIAIFSTFLERM